MLVTASVRGTKRPGQRHIRSRSRRAGYRTPVRTRRTAESTVSPAAESGAVSSGAGNGSDRRAAATGPGTRPVRGVTIRLPRPHPTKLTGILYSDPGPASRNSPPSISSPVRSRSRRRFHLFRRPSPRRRDRYGARKARSRPVLPSRPPRTSRPVRQAAAAPLRVAGTSRYVPCADPLPLRGPPRPVRRTAIPRECRGGPQLSIRPHRRKSDEASSRVRPDSMRGARNLHQ